MDISIVIPVYNAGDIVEGSVKRLINMLDPLGLDYEILLRDDGSTDGSADILKQMVCQNLRVRSFFNLFNQGLGVTLRSLFDEAKGKKIVYCDCDLPFGEEIIPILLRELENSDIAVASRYKGIFNDIRPVRKIFSRLYYFFCKILFRVPVSDIGSGSVAVCRAALDGLDLNARGFDIHVEFYAKAFKQGLLIKEIPAKAEKGKRRSFSVLRHGWHVAVETVGLRFRLPKGIV